MPSPSWHLALSAILILTAVAVLLHAQWRDRPRASIPPVQPAAVALPAADEQALADTLYATTEAALEEVGIQGDLVRKTRTGRGEDQIAVQVPSDLPLAAVNLHLTRFVEGSGGRVLRAVESVPGQQVEMRCGFDSSATTRFVLKRAPNLSRRTGRIAIVLDDFGYASRDRSLIERFCTLPQPLTFAILPNEGQIAFLLELAREHGHEVILHLPMEPDDPEKSPGEGAIEVAQDGDEIRKRVRAALGKVPSAVGVNNHMGSKATADTRVMKQVLHELKDRGLFFLDSRTSAESVAYSQAEKMGVPALSRDIFIDPVDDRQTVEAKLWELADLAARSGRAVGIGHDRESTLHALQAVLPRLERRGFRLVPLSHLAR
jgi:polysaccharide deacetylase 2 family uncharacterized protein YibQ